jgi:hypothetical protein
MMHDMRFVVVTLRRLISKDRMKAETLQLLYPSLSTDHDLSGSAKDLCAIDFILPFIPTS